MIDPNEPARELWNRYYIVTMELLKFINAQDIDEFLELVAQRKKLGEMIEQLPANNYRQTPECEALFNKIRPLDMQIIYKAKSWLNKAKKNNMAVKSYDLVGKNPLGSMVNREL